MTRNRAVLLLAALLFAGHGSAAAQPPTTPYYRLIDAAAERLATADAVAAYKWINGGPITDRARADQVLDAVAADAAAHGIDPQYVRTVFTDQIDATEGVQYTRFAQWKFDPDTAPAAAPDLTESRAQIDLLNKTMVEEIALQWNSLHSPSCHTELAAATDAVAAGRHLADLYRRALESATRSYCVAT